MEKVEAEEYTRWTKLNQARFLRKLANKDLFIHDHKCSDKESDTGIYFSRDNTSKLKETVEKLNKWIPIYSQGKSVPTIDTYSNRGGSVSSKLDTIREHISTLFTNRVKKNGKKGMLSKGSLSRNSIPNKKPLNYNKTFQIALVTKDLMNSERKVLRKKSPYMIKTTLLKESTGRRTSRKGTCVTPKKIHTNGKQVNKSLILGNLKLIKSARKNVTGNDSQEKLRTITKVSTGKTLDISPSKIIRKEKVNVKSSLNEIIERKASKTAEHFKKKINSKFNA